jgi:hypothetical protein
LSPSRGIDSRKTAGECAHPPDGDLLPAKAVEHGRIPEIVRDSTGGLQRPRPSLAPERGDPPFLRVRQFLGAGSPPPAPECFGHLGYVHLGVLYLALSKSATRGLTTEPSGGPIGAAVVLLSAPYGSKCSPRRAARSLRDRLAPGGGRDGRGPPSAVSSGSIR